MLQGPLPQSSSGHSRKLSCCWNSPALLPRPRVHTLNCCCGFLHCLLSPLPVPAASLTTPAATKLPTSGWSPSSAMANATLKPLCPVLKDMSLLGSHSNSSLRYMDHISVLLHGLAALLGLVENGLIVFVVGCRMRQTVVTTWALHLALSDLLASAALPFFTYFLAVGHSWELGTAFCKLHSSVFFLNMFASGFLLSAISLDRCVRVVHPVWAQNHRSVSVARRVCAVLWALALLNTVPYFVFRDTILRRDGRTMCYYNVLLLAPAGDHNATCGTRQMALALSKFLLAFALPLGIIAASHAVVSARLQRRPQGGVRPGRFVRLVAAVVAAFALCWGPYHAFSLIEARAHAVPSLRPLAWRALPFVSSLAFINSVVNPLLYVLTCPDVGRKLRRSLRAVLESVLVDDGELGSRYRRRGGSSSPAVASASSSLSLAPATHQACSLLRWLRGSRGTGSDDAPSSASGQG
ncbi:prostaglandin D2 receptor 2 isoform X2 [Cavia porcellus]|uniref:prostaglandin D2 receptor 2 isoform X2 n=1 Tax=Cavia porcellus TaxID=10141 RepID=UPI000661F7EA|nr:prostaglandin D2 receptor 2 isoform X1 [Cavia porcellus]